MKAFFCIMISKLTGAQVGCYIVHSKLKWLWKCVLVDVNSGSLLYILLNITKPTKSSIIEELPLT